MDKVFIHDKVFVPFIPYDKISQIIDGVADRLNEDICDTPIQKDPKKTSQSFSVSFTDPSCSPENFCKESTSRSSLHP